MKEFLFEILIIIGLLVINGIFAMTEIAVVSARKARLKRLAEKGDAKARLALQLAESPNRFLSTVQIGITIVGILAGAVGGASLSEDVGSWLVSIGIPSVYADEIAFVLVVGLITYLSLVIGELVPKRIGLSHPEGIARWVAKPMHGLSVAAGPLVRFLGESTDLLLRLFGVKPRPELVVTEEEVRGLMQEGVRAGAFNRMESQIVHSALEIDLVPVSEIMTPRPKVIWLNQNDTHEQVWHKIAVSGHSNFPVYLDNRDHVVGVVSVKAIYANLAAGVGVTIKDLMTPPLIVPESQTVLQLVETFKQGGRHVALVTDEFGSITGMVTINDVMEAILGEFASQGERAKPSIDRRPDGSFLIDAMIDLESIERAMTGFSFGEEARSEYQTLAGYVVKNFGRVPREGETFEVDGYVFEVLDMDRHRVDKMLVIPPKTQPGT